MIIFRKAVILLTAFLYEKNNLAVIAGGTGAIGKAIADQLNQIGFSDIIKIGTKTSPAIDFNDENSILDSAEYIQKKQAYFNFFRCNRNTTP